MFLLILQYGLPLVALLVFAGELGIPTGIPIEVALLLVGAYAVHSLPALVIGVLLVAVADLAGTTTLHLLVRTGGVRLLGKLLRRHEAQGEESMARWRQRLGGHDAAVVFVVRLLPLVRMYITIATGLMRIRLRHFLLGAAPAALVWAGTPLVLGYAFRADVHRWAAHYSTGAHLLLAALPLIGLATGVVWWVRRAPSPRMALRRGRSVLGLLAAVATAGYLARLLWANDGAVAHGSATLPQPVLVVWVATMATIALCLLGFAYVDLRAAVRHRTAQVGRSWMNDLATTVAWAGVVAVAAAIPVVMELRYPAL
jgi:membrane protein DedA with SNARE-associated domain